MRARVLPIALAIAAVGGGFAACKDNTVNQSATTNNNFTSIGPAGGFATGPDGTRVDVPGGAVSEPVNMGILAAEASEYPAMPATVTPIGKIYAFHPHGQFFLIDATITMPAPAGDVDIYRAEPGGSWALFAKPKGNGGFAKFRTSTFSFYAAAAGTGGCVRDLDCVGVQKCSAAGVCTGGGDADGGIDSSPPDGSIDSAPGGDTSTPDTATCTRTPSMPGKTGTVTSTASWVPKVDGVATTSSGSVSGGFYAELDTKYTTYANACGYAAEHVDKVGATIAEVRLRRTSKTAAPAFVAGTYALGTKTTGDVTESVNLFGYKLSDKCMGAVRAPLETGTVTIEIVSATNVKGSFNVIDDGYGSGPYSGTFDVPLCNTAFTGTACCVP